MADGTRTIKIRFDGSAKGLITEAALAARAINGLGSKTDGLKKGGKELDAFGDKVKKTATDSQKSGSLIGAGLALGVTAAAPLVAGGLVAGVALGGIGMVVAAQKNNAKVVASFSALKTQAVSEIKGVTDQAVPYLVNAGHELQQTLANFGPELKTAFRAAGPDIQILTSGVTAFATNAMPGFTGALRNSYPIVSGLATLMGKTGSTITTVLTAVSSHSQVLGHDFSQVGDLVQNLGGVVAGVLPGLASGFGGTVGAVNTLLTALQPIVPALGAIAGQVLPVVGMAKLFGLAGDSVESWGTKLQGAGSKIATASGGATGLSKSLGVTGKVISSVGSALPILGAGLGLVSDAMAAVDKNDQVMTDGLVAGGQAARDAVVQITAASSAAVAVNRSAARNFGQTTDATARAADGVQQFEDKVQDLTKDLDPLQAKTATYNAYAIHFGANSTQAKTALADLNRTVKDSKAAQDANNLSLIQASADMNTLYAATLSQYSATLALQGAQQSLTDADTAYNAAVKQSGAGSAAARQAYLQEQNAILGVVNAAGAKAKADDDEAIQNGKKITGTQEATDQTIAERKSVEGLINGYVAAGKTIPAALVSVAAGLEHTTGSAIVTAAQVDNVSARVRAVPPGKKVTVDALTATAVSELDALGYKVTHLKNGKFSVSADTNPAANALQSVYNKYNGKKITFYVSSSGDVRAPGVKIPARASGGPVRAGQSYLTGEHGKEIFTPQSNGYVHNAQDTASMMAGWTGDLNLTVDLGEGIKQVIRISNRDLKRAVKAGSGIR